MTIDLDSSLTFAEIAWGSEMAHLPTRVPTVGIGLATSFVTLDYNLGAGSLVASHHASMPATKNSTTEILTASYLPTAHLNSGLSTATL